MSASMFSQPISRFVLAASAASIFVACAPPNPNLTAPPETVRTQARSTAINKQIKVTRQVDILFVIDNSDSMLPHQEKLKANVDKFVAAFEANANVDFHIGVVSIFDTRRFGTVVHDFWPLGKLQQLKDPCRANAAISGPSYVTRESGSDMPGACPGAVGSKPYSRILGESLKIGTKARGNNKVDLGGAEYEDVFSPIVAGTKPETNPGFIRKDAHLAVIMLTDSNDKGSISPDDLYRDVLATKDNDAEKVSFYAILTEGPADQSGRPTNVCSDEFKLRDAKERPARIVDFMRNYGSRYFSLCDANGRLAGNDDGSYGAKLAEVGKDIEQKAAPASVMKLGEVIPDQDPERFYVTCAAPNGEIVRLQRDVQNGWAYDRDDNSVVIRGDAQLPCASGSPVDVHFVTVNTKKFGTKHVTFR